MATYDARPRLPLEVEGYELKGLEPQLSREFVRATTLIKLRGGGEEGVGEDVTYDGLDHVAFQAEGGSLPLAGSYTLELLLPTPRRARPVGPRRPCASSSRLYRRWAFESAALDLALRQAGRSLAERSAASRGR